MSNIPTQTVNPNGLHQRYFVAKWIPGLEYKHEWPLERRITGTGDAEYFVMRLDEGGSDPKHIAACRIGVHAYADAIKDHLPELSKDLKERYPLISSPSEREGGALFTLDELQQAYNFFRYRSFPHGDIGNNLKLKFTDFLKTIRPQ